MKMNHSTGIIWEHWLFYIAQTLYFFGLFYLTYFCGIVILLYYGFIFVFTYWLIRLSTVSYVDCHLVILFVLWVWTYLDLLKKLGNLSFSYWFVVMLYISYTWALCWIYVSGYFLPLCILPCHFQGVQVSICVCLYIL